jgi:hypothetical protein
VLKGDAMKKVTIPIIILLLSLSAYGDEETLISGEIESGGYGGLEVKFASINGEWEVLVGGRGGWIINHEFVIGAAGYGVATEFETGNRVVFPVTINNVIDMGYGGVLLGYISRSHRLVHVTLDVLIGGGGLSQRDDVYYDYYYDDTDAFFIIEPNVNFELNVSRKIRFAFGGGYRITSGVEYFNLDDDDISGTSINLMMKFGKF